MGFRGDRRDSEGPHPGDQRGFGDQRGPGGQRGPGDQRGSFRGDRRDSGGPHPGDQRHFGQAQPPMPSPQSTSGPRSSNIAQNQGSAPPLPPGPAPRNEPMPNFDNSASQPAKPNNAPPISTGSTKQQEQFEQMFAKWEWQFEEWKRKNMDNPDQEYVDKYINDMNLMKNRLMERR